MGCDHLQGVLEVVLVPGFRDVPAGRAVGGRGDGGDELLKARRGFCFRRDMLCDLLAVL